MRLGANFTAGDFQMRVSLWTDDIADPSEIASYFAYFPNIESLHSGWQDLFLDQTMEQYAQLHRRGLDVALTAGAVDPRAIGYQGRLHADPR